MKQGYIYILCTNVSNRISKELQPRDHRISSTTQPDRQGVKHPSRNHPVHEQTEVVETAASVGRNRILISGKRGGGMKRGRGGMNSLWKIASNSHSRAIIPGDQTGRVSPIIHLFSLPPHELFSRFISFHPLFVHLASDEQSSLFASILRGFRGRPTDSHFPEKNFLLRRKRADRNSIFEYRKTCSHFTIINDELTHCLIIIL